MGKCMKLVWGVAILLGLVALVATAHCPSTPVEVVYTGGGCEYPKMLDYQINLPYPVKQKIYQPSEYNYKIDVPVPPKAKVAHYTFDFVVEEPHKPKPPPPEAKYTLCAKIDRIALKKADYEEVPSYELPPPPPPPPPPEPPAPAACACTEYTGPKPHYGYVYKKVQPCRCQRSHCKCNAQRTCGGETHRNSLRKKRDLRAFFRPRKPVVEERPGRFVKQYHKSLPIKRQAAFQAFPLFAEPMPMFFNPNKLKRSKLVKRDIMGEYDLLEREREQMDLTLPEIIQYMPETLQPNFKRGQCSFGCSERKPQRPDSSTELSIEAPESKVTESDKKSESSETNSDNNSDHNNDNKQEETTPPPTLYYFKESPSQNAIGHDTTSTYTKRNAGQYSPDVSQHLSESVSQPTHVSQNAQSAHYAHHGQQSTRHASHALPPPVFSAISTIAQPPKYAYDNRGQKYLEHNGRMRLITTSLTVPDLTHGDGSPLQYAGDLNAPPAYAQPKYGSQSPVVGAPQYPMRPISNAALDKIITDIVHRHPEFIEASSHYGGDLVDPEPWQKKETNDFLQKLIAGRLGLWFGEEEEHYNPYHNIGYSNPYQRHQRRSVPNLNYYTHLNQS